MTKDASDPGDDGDEAAAFAEAVRGARKLAGAPRLSPPVGAGDVASVRRPQRPSGGLAVPPAQAQAPPAAPDEAGEVWSARADGVDGRVIRKLRGGAIPIEARIDLHGLTRARAAAALARFIAASQAAGRRCLLVIHGRGLHSTDAGAPLRDLVRQELTAATRTGMVLACGSAPPQQGGAGATLAYLRR